jgi:N-acetyl-alpha-D-muramate 1-phosphate uridylyltransferase
MTVFRNNGSWDTSNASFDGRFVRYNKRNPTADMSYIDYGLGILTDKALLEQETNTAVGDRTAFDLAEVYAKIAAAGQLAGYEASKRFYEIGTLSGCAEADYYLGRRHCERN